MKLKSIILTILLLYGLSLISLNAQELQCAVTVSAPSISGDQQIFSQMEDGITRYVNLRRWGTETYAPDERIKCRMQIILTERDGDRFSGSIQVQLIRPVFNSTYESLVLNIKDDDFNISYVPFQALEFNENAYIDNLTSILNFYAYIILAVDGHTFELNGGNKYFQKAQNIVNLASGSGQVGWRAVDGQRNRARLVEDFLNLNRISNIYYTYHRNGLDMLARDINRARSAITGALREMQNLRESYPGRYIFRIFLDAKIQEIIDVYRDAMTTEKRQVVSIMQRLDPTNSDRYSVIMSQ